jgi:hypothetical protein
MADVGRPPTQLVPPDDRGHSEFAFADERLRVDHEPWLTPRPQHVVGMKVLVHQHLLAL